MTRITRTATRGNMLYISCWLAVSAVCSPAWAQMPVPVPYAENFDGPWSGGAPNNDPNVWTKEFVSGTDNWVQYDGGLYETPPPNGTPGVPVSGYNALLYQEDYSGPETRLISPQIDLGGYSTATMTFWYAAIEWSGNEDDLSLWYRPDTDTSWRALTNTATPLYTNPATTVSDQAVWLGTTSNGDDSNAPDYYENHPTKGWTQVTYELPHLSPTYQIAFHAYAYYGFGVCLDEVHVNGITNVPAPVMVVVGTNQVALASGESASHAKGTDIRTVPAGGSATRTLSIANAGDEVLNISSWITSGTDAGLFTISGIATSIPAGGADDFRVQFDPVAPGSFSASLEMVNDSTSTPYVVNLVGSAYTVNPDNGPFAGGYEVTIRGANLGNGSDITNVAVGGVAATILDQGTDGVEVTLGASPDSSQAVTGDIVVQSASIGETTLPNAYTYNPAGQIVQWEYGPNVWTNLGSGIKGGNVQALHYDGAHLYVGGYFTNAGGVAASCIAQFDPETGAWTHLGAGANAGVMSITHDGTNLYIGGGFWTAGGTPANRIARWDGSAWTNLGSGVSGGYEWIAALTHDGTNLYAGGNFTNIDGQAIHRIAKWNPMTEEWSPLAGGVNGAVRSLLYEDDRLYAAGDFTTADGAGVQYIAQWDGAHWYDLDGGMNHIVYGLAHDGVDLYATGSFEWTGPIYTRRVAQWNGASWTNLGSGLNTYARAVLFKNGLLYAGGYFTDAGGVTANRVAQWDGSAWNNLGSGLNDLVYDLAHDGTYLYAGGRFTNAGGVAAARIAKWGPSYIRDAGVAPDSGSWTGGNRVVISGTNLCNGTDITNVTLAGVSAAILGQSSTQVIVVAEASSSGAVTGDVRVYSTSHGETVRSNAYEYLRTEQAPLVFTPSSPQAYNTTNTLSAGGGSGTGSVSYAVLSGPGMITNDTSLVVTAGTGTVSVVATKAQDALYFATSTTSTVAAARAPQTISFPNPGSQFWTNTTRVTATASSGLWWVQFTVVSGPAAVAHGTNEAYVTYDGYGEVRIAVSQAGNSNWLAAATVTNTFDVLGPQFVGFGTNGAVVVSRNAVSTADGTDFGDVLIGRETVTNVFTIRNAGNATLTFSGVVTNGPQAASFRLLATTNALPAGASLPVPVVFDPRTGGTNTASFEFTYDGTNSPYTVNVAGTGLGGGIALATRELAFASTFAGVNPPVQPLVLTNIGVSAFTWTHTVAYSGGSSDWLSVAPDTGTVPLASATSLVHSVEISGLAAGTHKATVTIAGDATNSPQAYTVALTIGKAAQAITFPNPGLQVVTNETPIAATASSGLPVSLAVVSGAEHLTGPIGPSSPTTLSYRNPGQVTLRATQAGNADWQAAAAVEITFRVRTDRVPYADFDGDGCSDVSVFYPAGGMWYILESERSRPWVQNWGWHETVPVPADYDGDGKVDMAVYDPAGGMWYILESTTGSTRRQNWGWSEAQPVPADYDGDGLTDLAVYHQREGNWYILLSATAEVRQQKWGWHEAVPVPEDYDGDGKADMAVYYPAGGMWYILQSTTGTMRKQNWGWHEVVPVPEDYDGDGLTDLAVYHQANGDWYILDSTTAQVRKQAFGWSGPLPVPGDYDGDGKADLAVFEPSLAHWYILHSTNGEMHTIQWGWNESLPTWPAWR